MTVLITYKFSDIRKSSSGNGNPNIDATLSGSVLTAGSTAYINKWVETHDAAAFQLYPNPSNDFLEIQLKENSKAYIQIFNSTGRIRLKTRLNNSDKKSISLDSLSPDVYYLRLQQEQIAMTQRWIRSE